MILDESIEECHLVDKGDQKILRFSKEFASPVSEEQKWYFSNHIQSYIRDKYKQIPGNYFIQTDSVFGVLVTLDLNSILYEDHSYEISELEQEFTTSQDEESTNHRIKKVKVPIGQYTELFFFQCQISVIANSAMKKEFLDTIQRYIEEEYGDEESFFFEETENDTLLVAVLINH